VLCLSPDNIHQKGQEFFILVCHQTTFIRRGKNFLSWFAAPLFVLGIEWARVSQYLRYRPPHLLPHRVLPQRARHSRGPLPPPRSPCRSCNHTTQHNDSGPARTAYGSLEIRTTEPTIFNSNVRTTNNKQKTKNMHLP
jgi:hypothetical protein